MGLAGWSHRLAAGSLSAPKHVLFQFAFVCQVLLRFSSLEDKRVFNGRLLVGSRRYQEVGNDVTLKWAIYKFSEFTHLVS